ncbi:MAG: 7-carboxy-7-deazaguanine synthase [Cyanobacteria bacterium REEB65]|nr:7-carboxy-7-deazaguanine synthase [Cyanobacteria bacterium REEB65]
MRYSVKEIFYTLQGEGANSGRPAVFVRFAGCNLWTGRQSDRPKGKAACAQWCDTDFIGADGPGGGLYAAEALVERIVAAWSGEAGRKLVVFTGGEPLLQLDANLVQAIAKLGFEVAIETNGTLPVPDGVSWICVSPKAGSDLVVQRGDELKLVFPQPGAEPERFVGLGFRHFFLQPLDGPQRQRNTQLAVAYCLAHPQWRLSLQVHKIVGIR